MSTLKDSDRSSSIKSLPSNYTNCREMAVLPSRKDCIRKKRKFSETGSSDDERYNFRRHKLELSKNHRIKKRRTSSRRKISSESDSEDSRNFKKCHRMKKRVHSLKKSSASNSDNFRHYEVSKKRSEEISSDVQIMDEKNFSNEIFSRSSLENDSDMQYYYYKSDELMKKSKFNKAINYINRARLICKNNDKYLSSIYARQGTILSEMNKPKCSLESFLDWEHAYKIDNTNLEARKNMAEVLFMGANKYYRMKEYEKALIAVEHSYDMIKDKSAYILIKLIKKKLFLKEYNSKGRKAFSKNSNKSSASKRKPISEKGSSSKSKDKHLVIEKIECLSSYSKMKYDKEVLDEIKHLNKRIAEAVETNNFLLALTYIKQALQLYEDGNQDDIVFRKLFVLKHEIMNMSPTLMKNALNDIESYEMMRTSNMIKTID